MRIAEKDVPKTAFITRYGQHEYTVVPFGLSNAPAAFMSVMNDVFKDYTDSFVMAYLDEIIECSKSWEEHIRHMRLVLDRLKNKTCMLSCQSAHLESEKSIISALNYELINWR